MIATKRHFRIDVLALLVALASLSWQIYDAIQRQQEHAYADVAFIRLPVPGKVDIVFSIHNSGSRPIYVKSFELHGLVLKDAETYEIIPWTTPPQRNAMQPGESLDATLSFKSLDDLRAAFQTEKFWRLSFESQGGTSVSLWMDPERKQATYSHLAFDSPNVRLNHRID